MRREHLRALVSAGAEAGGAFLAVSSGSMRPALREGDLLAVESCSAGDLRAGDVALFERGGRIWAHRFLWRSTGGLLTMKPDSAARPDSPLEPGAVLGRAVWAMRGPRRIELSSPWARYPCLARTLALTALRAPGALARAAARALAGNKPRVLDIEIAGVSIRVSAESERLLDIIRAEFGGGSACASAATEPVMLTVTEGLGSEAAPPGPEAGARREGDSLLVWSEGMRLRIDTARRTAGAAVAPAPGTARAAVSCILRNVATEFASRSGAAVLHASCAVRDGVAFVFAGASGTGKSTCAAMLPRAERVLDDLVFIGLAGGRAVVLPSPDFDRAGPGLRGEPVALAAVFVLSARGENRPAAERLSGAQAAAAVSVLPGPASGAEGAARALEAAERLARAVPVVKLAFGLNAEELGRAAEEAAAGRSPAQVP